MDKQDKGIVAVGIGFFIFWFLSVLLGLGLTGVVIWAIIEGALWLKHH